MGLELYRPTSRNTYFTCTEDMCILTHFSYFTNKNKPAGTLLLRIIRILQLVSKLCAEQDQFVLIQRKCALIMNRTQYFK